MSKEIVIGIDLGTTYSCVSSYQNGKAEIIENKSTGLRLTPSTVTFQNNERIIGKQGYIKNPEHSVYEIKRIIGKKFYDVDVQEQIKRWPFKVTSYNSLPKVEHRMGDKTESFHPEEISAMVLTRMKEIACQHFNQDVKKAVITVPAYFKDAQRKATQTAASIAGLEVLGIINEPTAAAIAYAYDKQISMKKNILIYDLGGGTFDVNIMEINRGNFKSLSVNGDTHLGGVDFDNRLVNHFVKMIKDKYRVDITCNKKSMQKLKTECEIAKRALSEALEYELTIELSELENDFCERISRAKFDELNGDLFAKTIDLVKMALDAINMEKNEIDEVVLIGGSIRIPKIQSLLKDYFGEINIEVTPLSLGTAVHGGIMSNIIKKNTTIPISKAQYYTTVFNDQTMMNIEVLEGERLLAENNIELGQFVLKGIQEAPAGIPQVRVTFKMDENGMLLVTAEDITTGAKKDITITNSGSISEEVVNKMISDGEKRRVEDQLRCQLIEAKNKVESECYKKQHKLKVSQMDAKKKKKLNDVITETLFWLKNTQSHSKNELLEKFAFLRNFKIF